MLAFLSNLVSMPGLIKEVLGLASKGIDYYLKKADGNVQTALEMMKTEQAANTVRIAGMSHPIWWLGWFGFVAPYAVFTWKVVVWDIVFGWGTTDPLKGMVGEWGGIIVASIFGGSFAMGALGLIFNRVTK